MPTIGGDEYTIISEHEERRFQFPPRGGSTDPCSAHPHNVFVDVSVIEWIDVAGEKHQADLWHGIRRRECILS